MNHRSDHARGQGLVEFALVLPLLLLFLLAIVDGGRAVFAVNGASEAARYVARVASVNCFSTTSPCDKSTGPIQSAISAQQVNLVGRADVSNWTITCVDPTTGVAATRCAAGHIVRVNVTTSFTLATPIVGRAFGPVTVASTSEERIVQ